MTKEKAYKVSLGTLTALAAVITPIATVISCGKTETQKQNGKDEMKLKGPHVKHYEDAGFMVSYIDHRNDGSYFIAGQKGFYTMKDGKVSLIKEFIKDDGSAMEKYSEWFNAMIPDGNGGYWVIAQLEDKRNKGTYSTPTYDYLRHIDAQGNTIKGWEKDKKLTTEGNQVRWIWSDGGGGFIFSHQGSTTTSKITKDGKIIKDWTPHRDGGKVRGIAKADGSNLWAIYGDNKLYKLDKDGKDVKGWNPIELPHASAGVPHRLLSDKNGGVIIGTTNNTIMKLDKDGKTPKGWKDVKIKEPKEHESNGINYISVNKQGYIGVGLSFGVFAMVDSQGNQLDLKFTNENHNIFKGNKNDKTIAIRSVTSDGGSGFIVAGFRKGQLAHIVYNK